MMLRTGIWHWLRLMMVGALLFGATGADCLTDILRDASDELNELADDLQGASDEDDLDDLFGDLFD